MKKYLYLTITALTIIMVSTSCSRDNIKQNSFLPKAEPDTYYTNKNVAKPLINYLKNDIYNEQTILKDIEPNITKGGKITKTNEGYLYTPNKDFIGREVIKYSICNNDSCSNSTITIIVKDISEKGFFNIPTELQSYYSNLTYTNDSSKLKSNLKDIISKASIKKYFSRHKYLYEADSDPENNGNVILMYSSEKRNKNEYESQSNPNNKQTFNTEHVFPKSKLSSSLAKSDLHHLRSCDSSINSARGNKSFTDSKGTYKTKKSRWYPGDEWKGDVARMVLYLNVMYGEDIDSVGSIELFLKWNKEDPVSIFEKQRNNEIQNAQNNRNPFVDNPYLATIIYGGKKAQNTWS